MKKLLFSVLLIFAVSNLFAQRSNVEVIYDYLYVFPAELGVFEAKPSRVIEQLNSNVQYGYNSWRLPNGEELALLKANGYAKYDATYMTSQNSNSRGIVLLVTTKDDIEYARKKQAEKDFMSSVSSIISQTGYIDLGLPSGTKWAAQNYGGKYEKYKYSRICSSCLPSQAQWQELRNECTWTWVESERGFIIKGNNGNAIFLGDTRGFYTTDGTQQGGDGSFYWSRTYLGEKKDHSIYYDFEFENGSIQRKWTWFTGMSENNSACVRYVQ